MSEINYQEAYEREHEKCADLADKIVVLESEKEDLQFKLDRIKKNKILESHGSGEKSDPFRTETEGSLVPLWRTEGYPA